MSNVPWRRSARRLTPAALLLLLLFADVADAQRANRRRAKRQVPTRVASRATPRPLPPPPTARSAPELAAGLRSTIEMDRGRGTWGAMVVSLTRGDTIYSQNADVPLTPASTLKLFTAALALEQFGPEHRFSTDVLRDTDIERDGTVRGSLYIRGGGDPAFSSRWVKRGEPDAPVAELARMVAAAGVRRVKGYVVGDASLFESRTIPEGWKTTYLGASYAARVSALSLSENLVWVAVTPAKAGSNATVVLEPSSSGILMAGRVRTTGGSGANVIARRNPDGSITVGGSIGARAGTRRYGLVVEDPARFTAGALRDALQRAGVVVEGGVRVGPTPSRAVRVASHLSPPLEKLVSDMNRESINHFAELLFRDAAHAARPDLPGSAETGNLLIQETLRKIGVAPGAVHAADGSGLSTLDRVNERAMVHLLAWAHRSPWGPVFHASLPVAGESELLRHRMRGSPAAGNLHAKTGTTDEVIGLSGYVTAANGEILAFSFHYNGRDHGSARSTIDRMGVQMAAFVRE